MTNLRILYFDLETAPLLAYIWNPTDDYVTHDRLIHDSWILTWSAKWAHETKVLTGCVTPTEAIDQDDSRILNDLANLIRSADIVVAHNGDRFDIPVLNGRLIQLGLEPIGPVRSIDTLKLARRTFKIAYKNLDYLGEILGLGRKLKTGFDLWKRAYHGDPKALKAMSKYNVQDVVLLEKVFHAMKPYVSGLGRLVEPDYDGQFACPTCGSEDLTRRGYHRTSTGTYQRYGCNSCGRYSKDRTANKNRLTVTPL
jgi:predicted RNA-binding Zn-ribbon protein involved in translation (DUF1610 family)